jgi:hypothetical protein
MGKALATGLVILLANRGIAACRCKAPSAGDAYRKASAVVLAKARPAATPNAPTMLDVTQVWKVDLPKTIEVDGNDLDCPQEFDAGITYVLYLSSTPQGGWKTDGCAGNKPVDSPKLPARFGKIAQGDLVWLKKNGKAGKIL